MALKNITPTTYNDSPCCGIEDDEGKEHFPVVYIRDLPKEVIEGHSVGTDVAIVLFGKLTEISMRERDGEDDNHNTVDIEVHRADIITEDDTTIWDEIVEGS